MGASSDRPVSPTRSTLYGLLLVALLLGGSWYARTRRPAPVDHAGERPTPAAAPRTSGAPSLGDPAFDAALLPDVTATAATVTAAGGLRVTLDVVTRPATAFAPIRFRVRVEADAQPVVLDRGAIAFEMPMPMGEFRSALTPTDNAWYGAEATLPVCSSGDHRWFADVTGTAGGRTFGARFRLDLSSPK